MARSTSTRPMTATFTPTTSTPQPTSTATSTTPPSTSLSGSCAAGAQVTFVPGNVLQVCNYLDSCDGMQTPGSPLNLCSQSTLTDVWIYFGQVGKVPNFMGKIAGPYPPPNGYTLTVPAGVHDNIDVWFQFPMPDGVHHHVLLMSASMAEGLKVFNSRCTDREHCGRTGVPHVYRILHQRSAARHTARRRQPGCRRMRHQCHAYHHHYNRSPCHDY